MIDYKIDVSSLLHLSVMSNNALKLAKKDGLGLKSIQHPPACPPKSESEFPFSVHLLLIDDISLACQTQASNVGSAQPWS